MGRFWAVLEALALAVRDDSRKRENCGGGGNLDAGLQAGRLPNGPPNGPSFNADGLVVDVREREPARTGG